MTEGLLLALQGRPLGVYRVEQSTARQAPSGPDAASSRYLRPRISVRHRIR